MERRTPAEWMALLHPESDIVDPGGWRGEDAPSIYFPITRAEFERRLALSTVGSYDPDKAGLRTGWLEGGIRKPPAGGLPEGRYVGLFYDRWPKRTRKIVSSVGWVAFFGLLGLLYYAVSLPGETAADAFGPVILFALVVVGMQWAPDRGTPPSQTLRARRIRAWARLTMLVAVFPLIWGSLEVFGGWWTAGYALMGGTLMERWALWDFKWDDLFGDSQRQPTHTPRLPEGERS